MMSARRISLTVFVATTAILVVVHLESFGFVASGLTGLLHLATLGLGLLLLVAGAIRANARLRSVGAAMLLGAIAAIVAMGLIHRSQQARSKTSGDAVCAALDAWHEQHGRYPDTLQELVPAFLSNVPTSAMGVWSTIPFRYQRDAAGNDYSLAFDSPAWIVCERGRSRPWRCDD
jgi:hypothetical protein